MDRPAAIGCCFTDRISLRHAAVARHPQCTHRLGTQRDGPFWDPIGGKFLTTEGTDLHGKRRAVASQCGGDPPVLDCSIWRFTGNLKHGEGNGLSHCRCTRNYHFLIDEFFRINQCLPWLKDLFAREKPSARLRCETSWCFSWSVPPVGSVVENEPQSEESSGDTISRGGRRRHLVWS